VIALFKQYYENKSKKFTQGDSDFILSIFVEVETRTLNLLNIGLMLLSCVVAFIIPFELFLFSYAVLGPLHYLTEIGWLHKRNYFVQGKNDFLWLGLMALMITLSSFGFKPAYGLGNLAPFIAICSAIAFVMIRTTYLKIAAIFIAIVAGSLIDDQLFYTIFFLVFLPTILHVFLFTGSFILLGALKSKSSSGISSLIVFIACAASFFILPPSQGLQEVSNYIQNSYKDFSVLNRFMLAGFDSSNLYSNSITNTIFHSAEGLMIMRFIAFSYTYHYLNWFSKTSVIKWHEVDRRYLIGTILIWIASVGVYLYDYRTGLKFLFFLSFLHVFLEFPLNFRTFKDIGKEMGTRISGPQKTLTRKKYAG
jgi:hypothetical protein